MRKVDVSNAIGCALAHDLTAVDSLTGRKYCAFHRGQIVKQEDLDKLKDLGRYQVYIEDSSSRDEVHEDDFAIAVASQLRHPSIVTDDTPQEGRVSIYANRSGVLKIDLQRLTQLHKSHPELVLPTLPQHYPVSDGQRIGAFRILPLYAHRATLDSCLQILAQKPLISIDPYTRKKVAIIVTGTEVYEGRITDRFIPLISKKIKTYDAFVTSATIVPDNHQRIVNEISRAMELADLVCITGGTSVDPDDITLSAITSSGASVVRQGVPRQPGNHLSIAYHPQATLVTVPAGALSVPCSTFDTYLPRLLADHRITADELATSAAGGLCQQCPSCHFPNCTFGAMR